MPRTADDRGTEIAKTRQGSRRLPRLSDLRRAQAPELFGASAVLWLILGGLLLIWLFFEWEARLEKRGAVPLVRT